MNSREECTGGSVDEGAGGQRAALAELQVRLSDGLAAMGLSVTQLAVRAGLGRTTVSNALNQASLPSPQTVAALCRVLKLELRELLELRRRAAGAIANAAGSDAGRAHLPSSTVPSSAQQAALELAVRRSRARIQARLSSTPDNRRDDVAAWMLSQSGAVVTVPAGSAKVLVAPMGAGKSEKAERWWGEGAARAGVDSRVAVPMWLDARDLVKLGLEAAVRDALGADLERECRIVIDNLELVSPPEASDRVLEQARQLVATWPTMSVLATARPRVGQVELHERIDVAPWPIARGLDLLRCAVGDAAFQAVRDHETRQLLTSPLLVHALASRLANGGDVRVSTPELLAGLASTVLRRKRRSVTPEARSNLPRLAALVLDSGGQVKASSFGRQHDLWELEETGLVVQEGDRLGFALPLFEQHFGAQALQDGVARLEEAAGPESFPRWRYAIAFAVDTAAGDVGPNLMLRLVRANPAAASWVLDELSGPAGQANMRRRRWDRDGDPAVAAGWWLRDAVLAWIEGLGGLGSRLARQYDEVLAPWGVCLDGEFMWVAEGRRGVLDVEVVARPELRRGGGARSQFCSRHGFPLPHDDLSRWVWARNRLRKTLSAGVHRRVLPVPRLSPLATERTWFLARRVLSDQRLRDDAPISVEDLRLSVNTMMKHAERAEWSTWEVGGDILDTDDVLWLHTELQHTEQDALTAPRPPGDLRTAGARYLWQEYSPELTLSIATAVLRDALTGYQQLVETSFPRFGHALGLYSTLPARAEGLLILPGPDAPADWPPSLEYTLHTDPAATLSAPPARAAADSTSSSAGSSWRTRACPSVTVTFSEPSPRATSASQSAASECASTRRARRTNASRFKQWRCCISCKSAAIHPPCVHYRLSPQR
ncbi:helix-turn-helix transcriptional regulator [Streptomyces sp. NPDC002082]|uniref:helix-turn-helix transcriptional regulator n=1 Tax=Streptomyces sp. NPDC002082 TaxID=3154772 RepID=UPI00331CADA2